MNEHFNKLTPSEAERLALLLEEFGEVQQVIGKILRHGFESCNPHDAEKTTNRSLLEKELGDAVYAINLMCSASDISYSQLINHRSKKKESVKKYLHHQ